MKISRTKMSPNYQNRATEKKFTKAQIQFQKAHSTVSLHRSKQIVLFFFMKFFFQRLKLKSFGRLCSLPDGSRKIFHQTLKWNRQSKIRSYSLENIHYKPPRSNFKVDIENSSFSIEQTTKNFRFSIKNRDGTANQN